MNDYVGRQPGMDVNSQIESMTPLAETAIGSLVDKGTTGNDKLDKTVIAAFQNQTAFAKGATPQEIMADAERQIPSLKAERLAQLSAATQNTPLNSEQILATAILQIAPMILGAAIGGKRGGVTGAQSGLLASGTFQKAEEANNAKAQQAAMLQAASLGEDIEGLTKQASDAQKLGIQGDQKMNQIQQQGAYTLGAANIRAQGEVAAAGQLADDKLNSQAYQGMAATMGVLTLATGLSEGYKSLVENAGDEKSLLKKYGEGANFFIMRHIPGSDEALVAQQAMMLQSSIVKAFSGAQVTDMELKHFIKILNGEAPLPSPEALARLTDNAVSILARMEKAKFDFHVDVSRNKGSNTYAQLEAYIARGDPSKAKKHEAQVAQVMARGTPSPEQESFLAQAPFPTPQGMTDTKEIGAFILKQENGALIELHNGTIVLRDASHPDGYRILRQ